MKFIIDAQLPLRLATFLTASGHDALHTTELPDGNRTTDEAIAARGDAEGRVVITKDRDFRDGHLLRSYPQRILIVGTGNIANTELLALFAKNLDAIVNGLENSDFVELGREALIVHRSRDEGGTR